MSNQPVDHKSEAALEPSTFDLICGGGVPQRSFLTAVIVGTVLICINQGDLILSGEPVVWWKIVMTYIVP